MARIRSHWPKLTEYEGQHLQRVALPLGGIGTGTVSLGGRGDLRDWEIVNRPAKGFRGGEGAFVLHVQSEDGQGVTRLLEGALQPPYEGAFGVDVPYHGAPRFRHCSFATAYPFGQVHLSDPDVPLRVRLEAYNPMVPADTARSSLPLAVLRYVLINESDGRLGATVCGLLRNFVGEDGRTGQARANRNRFRLGDRICGLYMSAPELEREDERWGTMALATTSRRVTYRQDWVGDRWNSGFLHLWDDLQDGRLTPDNDDAPQSDAPRGALAAHVRIPPGEAREIVFLLTWHFPNRMSWTPCNGEGPCCPGGGGERVGNYYTRGYADAWDVAVKAAANLDAYEEDTLRFVRAFLRGDLPDAVKEAALYNSSTLRTQTCFRTEDGRFFGWEGCCDEAGCCHGSCTHVWNYEQATAHLYGDLAWSRRETEFLHATDEDGRMSFRVNLPLERAADWGVAAADGQMGCIMKGYRDWQLRGDDEALRELWPKIKAALAFAWVPGGWDADRDGVMEGCQHNTLDVEYYGRNPLMAGWYLGALRAAEEMARYLGEEDFAQECRQLYEEGRAWVDANLFNGEYYEQRVVPPVDENGGLVEIAEGLRADMGAEDLCDPDFQFGPGCLVDQLVGQMMAHVCDLGYLLDPDHVRETLRNLMRYNWRDDLYGHFNHMRTFALNDESALLMCTWPKGGRPETPVPYGNEVMTGFEYSANCLMLYEGMREEGLRSIEAIRARYDGRRRNPYDEAECGHHYARAMASWAAVLALSGFHYSAVTGRMAFTSRPGTYFWSSGYAWGLCTIDACEAGRRMRLTVSHGEVTVQELALDGCGARQYDEALTLSGGQTLVAEIEQEPQ